MKSGKWTPVIFWSSVVGIAGVVGIAAVAAIFSGNARNGALTDWGKTARNTALRPCFAAPFEGHLRLSASNEEMTEGAPIPESRRVPSGFEKGAIIPEDCFAIAEDPLGAMTSFWERPIDRETGDFNTDIPFWIPHPDAG